MLSAALLTYDERRIKKIKKLENSVSAITAQLKGQKSCHISLQEAFDKLVIEHDKIKKNEIALLEKHNMMEHSYEQQLIKYHGINEFQKDAIQMNFTNATKLTDEKSKLLQASLAASTAQCSELEIIKKLLISENQNQNQKMESSLLMEEVKTLNIIIEDLKAKVEYMSGRDVDFVDSYEEVLLLFMSIEGTLNGMVFTFVHLYLSVLFYQFISFCSLSLNILYFRELRNFDSFIYSLMICNLKLTDNINLVILSLYYFLKFFLFVCSFYSSVYVFTHILFFFDNSLFVDTLFPFIIFYKLSYSHLMRSGTSKELFCTIISSLYVNKNMT